MAETQMCTFTSKDAKGKYAYSCRLVAQKNSAFCPRHTFLANVKKLDEDRKDLERQAQRREARGGTAKNRKELLERGYQFTGSATCHGCSVPIEWWRTPMGKSAPFNPMPELTSHATSHFATCRRSTEFRRAS